MSWTRRPLGLQAWLVTAFVAMGVIASLAVLLMVLPTLENSIRSDQANREGKRVSDSLSVPTDAGFCAQSSTCASSWSG